jgi:hypothetical protein
MSEEQAPYQTNDNHKHLYHVTTGRVFHRTLV